MRVRLTRLADGDVLGERSHWQELSQRGMPATDP